MVCLKWESCLTFSKTHKNQVLHYFRIVALSIFQDSLTRIADTSEWDKNSVTLLLIKTVVVVTMSYGCNTFKLDPRLSIGPFLVRFVGYRPHSETRRAVLETLYLKNAEREVSTMQNLKLIRFSFGGSVDCPVKWNIFSLASTLLISEWSGVPSGSNNSAEEFEINIMPSCIRNKRKCLCRLLVHNVYMYMCEHAHLKLCMHVCIWAHLKIRGDATVLTLTKKPFKNILCLNNILWYKYKEHIFASSKDRACVSIWIFAYVCVCVCKKEIVGDSEGDCVV